MKLNNAHQTRNKLIHSKIEPDNVSNSYYFTPDHEHLQNSRRAVGGLSGVVTSNLNDKSNYMTSTPRNKGGAAYVRGEVPYQVDSPPPHDDRNRKR